MDSKQVWSWINTNLAAPYVERAWRLGGGSGVPSAQVNFDPFRHAFSSAVATIFFGQTLARGAGELVEQSTSTTDNNFGSESGLRNMYMDLYNNNQGRIIGSQFGRLSYAFTNNVERAVFAAAQSGQLIVNHSTDARTALENFDHSLWFGSTYRYGSATGGTFLGYALDEHFIGSSVADRIDAGGGDDAVDGGAGNDTIDGGVGRDLLAGGLGDDWIYGGADLDIVQEVGVKGAGADKVFLGDGNDFLVAGNESVAGSDQYNGGAGVDTLIYRPNLSAIKMVIEGAATASAGGTGVRGTASASGLGVDTFDGFESIVLGTQNDTVSVHKTAWSGLAQLDGSAGFDTLSAVGGLSCDASKLSSFECINLSTDSAANQFTVSTTQLARLTSLTSDTAKYGGPGLVGNASVLSSKDKADIAWFKQNLNMDISSWFGKENDLYQLTVIGGANDALAVKDGGWSRAGQTSWNSNVFNIYEYGKFQLLVDTDMMTSMTIKA